MEFSSVLKDNIKVFLPILGLLFVLILFYTVNLNSNILKLTIEKEDITGPPSMSLEEDVSYKAKVKTDLGEFIITLFEEIAPINVNNFIFLAENKFYNGLKFHRIIEDFSIQAGDRLGDGHGDAGYKIEPEIVEDLRFTSYTVAMVNSSQFFITLGSGDYKHLDGEYTIIGQIIEGADIVEEIGSVRVNESDYSPRKDIFIQSIEILKERK